MRHVTASFCCLVAALSASAAQAQQAALSTTAVPVLKVQQLSKDWTITIRPAESRAAKRDEPAESPNQFSPIAAVSGETVAQAISAGRSAPVSAASGESAPAGLPAPRMSYGQAYNSVPFSRAEYEANPAYRHEAAMELMFGAMRPTATVKQTIPYFSRYPDLYRFRYPVFPYQNLGGSSANVTLFWNPGVGY